MRGFWLGGECLGVWLLRCVRTSLDMKDESGHEMPVLWHQCWLSFVKIYGKDCSEEQKIAMLKLTFSQKHREIGPAIREVIKASCPRDLEIGTGDDMTTGGVF